MPGEMKENQKKNKLMYQIKKSNLRTSKKPGKYNKMCLKKEVSSQILTQTQQILTLIRFQPGKKAELKEKPKVVKNHAGNVLRYSLWMNPIPNLN